MIKHLEKESDFNEIIQKDPSIINGYIIKTSEQGITRCIATSKEKIENEKGAYKLQVIFYVLEEDGVLSEFDIYVARASVERTWFQPEIDAIIAEFSDVVVPQFITKNGWTISAADSKKGSIVVAYSKNPGESACEDYSKMFDKNKHH